MEQQVRRPIFYPSLLFGVAVVTFGLILLLRNLGVFPHVRRGWTFQCALLFALGLSNLLGMRSMAGRLWGLIMVGLAALLLVDGAGFAYINFGLVWPTVLILIGITLLWKAMVNNRHGAPEDFSPSVLKEWAAFGGGNRRVTAQDFRGGEVFAVFGGFDIDLRNAVMDGDTAVVDLTAIFGGVVLRVPENWLVQLRATPVFGGYDDKSARPNPGPGVQTLIVKGCAIFGGVEIKN